MKNLEATKIVRKIVRLFKDVESYYIYTNKYEKCRTVKFYGDYTDLVQTGLDEVFGPNSGITVKTVTHRCPWRPSYVTKSTIVRIPFDKFPN